MDKQLSFRLGCVLLPIPVRTGIFWLSVLLEVCDTNHSCQATGDAPCERWFLAGDGALLWWITMLTSMWWLCWKIRVVWPKTKLPGGSF